MKVRGMAIPGKFLLFKIFTLKITVKFLTFDKSLALIIKINL